MTPKAYKYDRTNYLMKHESDGKIIKVADYWTFYTTGAESVVSGNEEKFFYSKRYENERYDSLAFDLYLNENFSDTLLAFNNSNYITDLVMDYDTIKLVTENRVKYIQRMLNKHFDEDEEDYYLEKQEKDLREVNDIKRVFLAPRYPDVESANRLLKEYFNSRRLNENKD